MYWEVATFYSHHLLADVRNIDAGKYARKPADIHVGDIESAVAEVVGIPIGAKHFNIAVVQLYCSTQNTPEQANPVSPDHFKKNRNSQKCRCSDRKSDRQPDAAFALLFERDGKD